MQTPLTWEAARPNLGKENTKDLPSMLKALGLSPRVDLLALEGKGVFLKSSDHVIQLTE